MISKLLNLQSVLHPNSSLPVSNDVGSTVILGGGIIGLSTAYYMALAEYERMSNNTIQHNSIVVIDPCSEICAGASGQNEGALGDFGFEDEVMPLANLSYKLHAQIATNNKGREKFGFGDLRIHTVFSKGYDPSNPKLPFPVKEQESLSKLPSWVKVPPTWQAGLISDGIHATRSDPPKLCRFLQEECKRLGVLFYTKSTVTHVHTDKHQLGLSHVDVKQQDALEPLHLTCRHLVISAGSWSDKVFSELFPQAQCKIPMAEKQPAQNWLRIRNPNWKPEDDAKDCDQVFLAPALADVDVHFSSYLGGDIYVASGFEDPDPPPPLPGFVGIKPADLEAMKKTTAKYLGLESGNDVELLASGRAYLPRTTNDLPIITKLLWSDLFPSSSDTSKHHSGGVFLNLGQYLDGYTLGPGSGKVMSELICGKETSVDLSPFGLPK